MPHKTLDITDLAQVATEQDLEQLKVKVGTELTYQYYKHSSVGNEVSYTLSDEAVCKLVSNKVEYNNPENMKSGWTGGDAATGTFIFQVLQKGECIIKIQHLFRGELEEEKALKVIVI